MFKISYVIYTGFGDLLDGMINFGGQVFEGFDYALESLADMNVTATDGVPIKIDPFELPGTMEQTQKNLTNLVFFYLYTRDNPSDGQKLIVDDKNTLQNSNFNVSKNTLIYAHGLGASYTDQNSRNVRDGMRLFIEKNQISLISFE